MKIRLHGLPEEVEQTKELLCALFNVNSVSEPYADRGQSKLVRRYIETDSKMLQFTTKLFQVLEQLDMVGASIVATALLDCKTCPISVNCFAIQKGEEKNLCSCAAMCELVSEKIHDRYKPKIMLDDKIGVRKIIEDFCLVKKGGDQE